MGSGVLRVGRKKKEKMKKKACIWTLACRTLSAWTLADCEWRGEALALKRLRLPRAPILSNTSNRTDKSKVASAKVGEFRGLASGSPQCSFGSFLQTHPPSRTMKTVTQTPIFWKRFSWWWLYFNDSLSEVHVEFGQSLRQALKQYVTSTGNSILVYDPAACVVHYRLGDLLDPNY